MDTFIGRPTEPGDWTVDHRNGVRDDNRLSNL
ncbi:HNH endonuclease [Azospirillum baldaniorum]